MGMGKLDCKIYFRPGMGLLKGDCVEVERRLEVRVRLEVEYPSGVNLKMIVDNTIYLPPHESYRKIQVHLLP